MRLDQLTTAACWLLGGWLLVMLGLCLALLVVEAACLAVDRLVDKLRGR